MDSLKGPRRQEQERNLQGLSETGSARAHEAAENHRGKVAPQVEALDPEGEAALNGVQIGDRLLRVGDLEVQDVLEFTFLTSGEPAELTFLRSNESGEDLEIRVELPGLGPSGITFERELFDGVRRCKNNCVFCFVHQLPAKVVRRSLLVKDEDYRLSFLHGGYVTMGNFSEEDYERIFDMHLSPLYVSIHATDLEVRRRMLGNDEAPDVRQDLARLRDHGIEVHGQIVLVPGYNDGDVLRQSLEELAEFENILGVAVVPVGLTKYRKNLPDLRELTAQEARQAIEIITEARQKDPQGERFFAADELFSAAGLPLPGGEYYGSDFPLREDGVGMIRSFEDGFQHCLKAAWPSPKALLDVALVTGVAAAPHFRRFLLPALSTKTAQRMHLVEVTNHFFGEGITVGGLLTAEDIVAAIEAHAQRFDRVLLGEHIFQPGGEVTLDGWSLSELSERLNTEVLRVPDDPRALLEAFLGQPIELDWAPYDSIFEARPIHGWTPVTESRIEV